MLIVVGILFSVIGIALIVVFVRQVIACWQCQEVYKRSKYQCYPHDR